MQKPIILHVIPSLMIGGAEKLLIDLLTIFQTHPKNKFEHQVIYFQPGPYLERLEKLNIKTYYIHGLINHYDPICFWRLLKLIKMIRPKRISALLWTANFYSRVIGKILNISTICAIHSNHNSGNQPRDNLIKNILDQYTLNWANSVIVVSQEIKLKFSQPSYNLSSHKLILINNGVNLPANFSDKSKSKQFVIGHVGRFVPVKNQQLLIQALQLIKHKIPNFKAVIIGQGPLELSLKQLAQNLELSFLIDFIKTHEPEKYYPLFDCFVLPSQQEGQSIALLEAMSWGVVPIVTSSDQRHEIIQHLHNGLMCKPNDVLSLAQAIITLYEDHQLNLQLCQTAKFTVKNYFNLEHTASNYLALY